MDWGVFSSVLPYFFFFHYVVIQRIRFANFEFDEKIVNDVNDGNFGPEVCGRDRETIDCQAQLLIILGLDLLAVQVLGCQRLDMLKQEAGVVESSQLNIAVSDGNCAVVTRYSSDPSKPPNSLYVHAGAGHRCVNGRIEWANSGQEKEAVIVASEPLSSDSGWTGVAANTALLIAPDLEHKEISIPPFKSTRE